VKLLYVSYPAFILFTPIQNSIDAGHVTAGLATTTALYSAWATGALFTLNPLGDEGAVLPVTVTSGVTGRQFVGGLVAASALIGTPVTVALAVVLAALSPIGVLPTICTVVAALVLPTLAASVAAGVGTAFPKYEATSITRSREAVVPSMWAFGVYTLAFLLTAGFATGFQTPAIAGFVADAAGTSAAVVHVASLAFGVLLAGAAAVLAVRTAVRAFDDYTASD
jgi:ABC-2 type transport system permease protein